MISNEAPLVVVISKKMSTSSTRKQPWGEETLQCWQTHAICDSLINYMHGLLCGNYKHDCKITLCLYRHIHIPIGTNFNNDWIELQSKNTS